MKISEMGEKRIIEAVRTFTGSNRYVLLGFGDDGAVLDLDAKCPKIVISTDILVEGTHFLSDNLKYKDLGCKSYEVNASDIAAMGAWPIAAFISLCLPPDMEYRLLKDFYKGFSQAAKKHDCQILGGDTVRSDRFCVSITLLGIYKTGCKPLLRNGAKTGNRIYITGWPGESGMGFLLLMEKHHDIERLKRNPLVIRHLRPQARVREGILLAHSKYTDAAIDVSDGVYNELHHLSRESGKKIMIPLSKLPLSRNLCKETMSRNIDPIQMVLFGGEDYELLFTSSLAPSRIKRMFKQKGIRTPIHEIGWIEEGSGVFFLDQNGDSVLMENRTFEHFQHGRS